MTISLRKRLLWILLALILVTWGTSTLVTGIYAGRVMSAQVDRQLEQYSDLVHFITRVFSRQADEGLPLAGPWSIEDLAPGLAEPIIVEGSMDTTLAPALNIWLGDSLMAVLESSPRFDKPQAEGLSYVHRVEDDSHWRVLSRFDESTGLWTLVGIEVDAARRAMLGIFGRATFPLLVVLPLTIAMLYLGISRGLSPLNALAEQISRRSPRALDPVDSSDVPGEIQPVVDSLNSLLERLAYAIESEQRFTANAAHELMTPLAAIKTEVQLCQRQLDDPVGQKMLERIALRVDRASHTVEQLLTLARLDPDAPLPETELDLRRLLTEVAAETGHLAASRHVTPAVEVAGVGPALVKGSEEWLAILFRNLLINAFRYALEGSEVRIGLECREKSVFVEICNPCKPLSPEEFTRVSARFYRVPGSEGMGAGLGLSIVSRVANLHGAVFEARPERDGAGFCATLEFSRLVTPELRQAAV